MFELSVFELTDVYCTRKIERKQWKYVQDGERRKGMCMCRFNNYSFIRACSYTRVNGHALINAAKNQFLLEIAIMP